MPVSPTVLILSAILKKYFFIAVYPLILTETDLSALANYLSMCLFLANYGSGMNIHIYICYHIVAVLPIICCSQYDC